jgi:flagellar hook-length control protein FliK
VQAQPPLQQAAVAAAARPVAAEAAPAEAPAPAQPAQAAPSLPLAPPVVPQRTAPLHHVPRVVGTLLHVATQRGVTHARISLRPEDLGGIEVRLQSSPAGISAQLIADSPEAARLLTQAGDDLRRSLEQRDVNLLSLEVSTSGEERRGEQPGETRDPDGPQGRAGATGAEEGETAPDAPPTVLELPGGLLVDVLA